MAFRGAGSVSSCAAVGTVLRKIRYLIEALGFPQYTKSVFIYFDSNFHVAISSVALKSDGRFVEISKPKLVP
jgi:hypothetical protein